MRCSITVVPYLCLIAGLGCGAEPSVSDGAPVITSTPVTTADHNREYLYPITASDPDGDPITLSVTAPTWLSLDPVTHLLHGLAGWDHLGSFPVTVAASDGKETTRQTYTVTVRVGEIDCGAEFGDPDASPYILPFPVGRTYTLFQGYCPPNPTWGHHNWFAFDFDLAIGDTVLAARGGVVTTVVENNVDGNGVLGANVVYIQPGDGTVNAYVHLTYDGALVNVGDVVKQGQPIGLAGNTGLSSGPHLHFAVFDHGGYTREYSQPINFSHAAGPWNAHRGPVQGAAYTALP